MTDKTPYVVRICWLIGGLVAVHEPDLPVQVMAGINGPVVCEFNIPSYESLYAVLAQFGFEVVGVTFISDKEEVSGIRPPEFRAWLGGARPWLPADLFQIWRQVAHAAAKQNEMALMDVSSRIATVLSYCETRLHHLAEAYSFQLGAKARERDIREFQRFQDLHSQKIYLSIHALFWELAVLRDNLSEFAANYLFNLSEISSFKGLVKALRDNKWADDEFAIELVAASDKDKPGWIAKFTGYRNLFTHSAPIERVTGRDFATQDQMVIKDGRKVPQLYYPLPGNVHELMKRRSKGALYENMDELVAATSGKTPKRETEPDALLYLHSVLAQMSVLAERLIQRSPIAPVRVSITDNDIIGDIKVSGL